MIAQVISHWDDARTWRGERGHIAGTWWSLTGRASQTVGVKRIQVDPGMWSTPLHLEGAEEEIFYVLGGTGVSVQWEGEGDPVGYEVRAGDCLVHLALDSAHTLQAGPDGLDVLAFGQRTFANGITWLPRAGVAWLGETWAPVGAEEDHPWTREAAAGPARGGRASPRPSSIVHIADLEAVERDGATVGRRVRYPGARPARIEPGSDTPRSSRASSTRRPTATPPRRRSSSCSRVTATSLLWEDDGVAGAPGSLRLRRRAAGGHGRRARLPRRRGRNDAPHVRNPRSRARSATTPAPARCSSSGSA